MTFNYLTPHEQLRTQQICKWFYKIGTGRAQIRIRLRWTMQLFTYSHDGPLSANIISVSCGEVRLLRSTDPSISNKDWYPIQVSSAEVFQLKNDSV